MANAVTVALRRSREIPWGWGAGVSAAWFGVGLAALLGLTQHVHFVSSPTPGLHSWVTEHRYPIQQQIFWFYAVILGAPFGILVGHFVWAAMGSALRWSGVPNRMALRAAALSFLPMLVVWAPLSRLQPAASLHALQVGAIGSVFVLALVAIVSRFFAPASLVDAPEKGQASTTPYVAYARESHSLVRSFRLFLVVVVLPVDLYFACFHPNLHRSVDLFHEGEQLVPLLEVLRGGVPYRDVYLQHGFLKDLGFPWLGATLFGPTLAGVRSMQALVDPLGVVGAYALMISLTGARLLPALLFTVLIVASPVDKFGRAVFGLCSLAVLAWTLRGGTSKEAAPENAGPLAAAVFSRGVLPFFCSGVLAGGALLHSTEVGLYTLATGVLFLAVVGATGFSLSWSSRMKPLLGFVVGALLAWTPFALALAAHGALDDFLLNLLYQTRYQLEIWGKPFPDPFKTFLPLISGNAAEISGGWADRRFWWYLCPALLTLSGAWLANCVMRGRFRSSPFALRLLLLSIAAAFYFRTALGRSDLFHLIYGVLFPLMLMVFVADALWCKGRRVFVKSVSASQRATAAALLFAAAAAAMLPLCWVDRAARPGPGIAGAWHDLLPSWKRIRFDALRDARDIVPDSQRQHLNEVARFFATETTPEERVLDLTNQSARLFFADRRSATRYFQILYAALPEMQQEVIDRLETDGTRFALLRVDGFAAKFDGVSYRTRHPLIAQYVDTHFSPFHTIGELQIWKRNDPQP